MNGTLPVCREIEVLSFRGDRTGGFAKAIKAALIDERNGLGPGPSFLDCLLFIGHAGISVDDGKTYYAFGPDADGVPVWQVMDELKRGEAFPGIVRDDTAVFAAAQRRGLQLQSMTIILPNPAFQRFVNTLDGERQNSQYSYGYPDGDCNCLTWLERLGLPLLTGWLGEWSRLLINRPIRLGWRFGKCV